MTAPMPPSEIDPLPPPPQPPAPATPAPRYELFLLHAPGDHAFVHGYLLPAIGLPEAQVRVVGEQPVAAVKLDELQRALEGSRVFLVVLTPAFLADPWAQLAEGWAVHVAAAAERAVIPLVLEACQVPLHLEANVRLDFRHADEWEAEAERLRQIFDQPPPREPVLPCPYPGMKPFAAGDAAHFHGREREIDELCAHLRGGERELHVVGPSGSGKSSLVFAGLLPRLEPRDAAHLDGAVRTVVRSFRPGEQPVQRLAVALEAAGLAGAAAAAPPSDGAAEAQRRASALTAAVAGLLAATPGAERLLLVVDQLEELFALAPAAEQLRFAAAIAALRAEPRCVLLFTLRADFFAELMQSPLWCEGGVTHVDVAPLRGDGLRAAIEQPARDARVFLEPALVERLLADAESPGALPLMQETLVQLWEHRRRRLLPLAVYRALGDAARSGFAVVISRCADRCLAELSSARQRIARRVFLRLISFGEGRPDTRRQQPTSALRGGESPAELAAVLTALAAARLISLDRMLAAPAASAPAVPAAHADDDRVDLAHEALITAWPALTEWVKVRRADEERRRQLELRTAQWAARGRGTGGLLDLEELAAARAWRRSQAAAELGESPDVTALLDASERHAHRERTRRTRRLAITIAVLAAFTVVAILLAVIARSRAREADAQRRAADEQRALADEHRATAEGLLGASLRETGRQLLLGGRPHDAAPYFVAARERGLDDAVLRMLFHQATANPLLATLPHSGHVHAFNLSPDGELLATASQDGNARIWDMASGALRFTLPHPGPVLDVAFRQDGATLATIADDGAVRFWDLAQGTERGAPRQLPRASQPPHIALFRTGANLVALAIPGAGVQLLNLDDESAQPFSLHDDTEVNGLSFDNSGQHLLTLGEDHAARVWSTRTGEQLWRVGASPSSPLGEPTEELSGELLLLNQAQFSDDGVHLLTIDSDRRVLVWDLETKERELGSLVELAGVIGAATSTRGNLFASYGVDRTALVWNLRGSQVSPALRHGALVTSAAFSADGDTLATASLDQTAQLWDATSGLPMTSSLQHPTTVMDVRFTADGTRLLTLGSDNAIRIWDAHRRALRRYGPHHPSKRVAISPDWARLATVEGQQVRLWDLRSGEQLSTLALPDQAYVGCAVFTPDGARLIIGDSDGVARIWDVATGKPLGRPLVHGAFAIQALAVSADGKWLATAGQQGRPRAPKKGSARVWELASGEPVTPLLEDTEAQWLDVLEFAPDGRTLLTAGEGKAARLWRLPDGALAATLRHQDSLTSARFSPEGGHVLTASRDHTAQLWSAATGAPLVSFKHAEIVLTARFDRGGTRVITAGGDHQAKLWDAATGRPLTQPLAHVQFLHDAAFTAEGARAVTLAEDGVARIWDTATGALLLALDSEQADLAAFDVSPDGDYLLTSSAEHDVQLWDVATDPGTLEQWKARLASGHYPSSITPLPESPAPTAPAAPAASAAPAAPAAPRP